MELITATFNWAVRVYATLNRHNLTKHAMYILCNIDMHSRNHSCSGKAKSGIYCQCVRVALHIEHAMTSSLLPSMNCQVPHYFSICLINGDIQYKTYIYTNTYILISSTIPA